MSGPHKKRLAQRRYPAHRYHARYPGKESCQPILFTSPVLHQGTKNPSARTAGISKCTGNFHQPKVDKKPFLFSSENSLRSHVSSSHAFSDEDPPTESEGDPEVAQPVSVDVSDENFNNSLHINITTMEVTVESPLPTKVNEIDKIIRAGPVLDSKFIIHKLVCLLKCRMERMDNRVLSPSSSSTP